MTTEFLTYGGIVGTVSTANAATTLTTFRCSDITNTKVDHYKGCQVKALTGALASQYLGVVGAYSKISSEGAFTISPGSPSGDSLANGDTVAIY